MVLDSVTTITLPIMYIDSVSADSASAQAAMLQGTSQEPSMELGAVILVWPGIGRTCVGVASDWRPGKLAEDGNGHRKFTS